MPEGRDARVQVPMAALTARMAGVAVAPAPNYPSQHEGGRHRHALPSEMAPLVRRLQSLTRLSYDEMAAVESLARRPMRLVAARRDIHQKGDLPPPMVVVSGWACRQRLLSGARRQIVSILLPGDIVGLPSPCLPAACGAAALTQVRLVDSTPLYRFAVLGATGQAGLAQGLRATHQQDERLLTDQVMRLGRHTAYERFAHLLLELHDRLAEVGLAEQGRFEFPLTRYVLADALGLSKVHIQRTMQQLARDGLFQLQAGTAVLPRLDSLRAIAA